MTHLLDTNICSAHMRRPGPGARRRACRSRPRPAVTGRSRPVTTTFANARHLAPEFVTEITAMYQGTRLGEQELNAEIVDTSAAVRFPSFSVQRHVVERAEYVPGRPVRLAIDCGLSRHVGVLFFQDREREGATPNSVRRIISVFGDYYAVDRTSYDNAVAIKE